MGRHDRRLVDRATCVTRLGHGAGRTNASPSMAGGLASAPQYLDFDGRQAFWPDCHHRVINKSPHVDHSSGWKAPTTARAASGHELAWGIGTKRFKHSRKLEISGRF